MQIANNATNNGQTEMEACRCLHKLANLLNSKGNIRPSDSEIVQTLYQLPI